MLSFLNPFRKQVVETVEEKGQNVDNEDDENNVRIDSDAGRFDRNRMLLERAMKVHEDKVDFHYAPNVKVNKTELEGVPEAFLLHNVLTEEECLKYIKETERLGYTDAPISTGLNSARMMKDVRNNLRVMWKASPEMTQPIWERICDLIPETITTPDGVWNLLKEDSLNERFRFYRYDMKQSFEPHFDGCFPRSDKERSHFTCIIYLNEGFDGGETTFYPRGRNSMWNQRGSTQ